MAVGPKRLREIAIELAKHMGPMAEPRPELAHVRASTPSYDVMREANIRRIRHLAKAYGLQWLVDQETYGYTSLVDLDEIALSNLVLILERGRECLAEGISPDDAGLVRSVASEQRSSFICSRASYQAERAEAQRPDADGPARGVADMADSPF